MPGALSHFLDALLRLRRGRGRRVADPFDGRHLGILGRLERDTGGLRHLAAALAVVRLIRERDPGVVVWAPVFAGVVLAALIVGNAPAQDKASYEQRTIARYVELLAWLDQDRNGDVSRTEAAGSIDFAPVFDDIDINRDGIVTKAELDRFLASRYGYAVGQVAPRATERLP